MESWKHRINDKGSVSLSGKLIYVVGPRRLQNELMVFFLQEETGATALMGENPRGLHEISDDYSSQPNLVLLDCQGRDAESLLAELESFCHGVCSRMFIALFNVPPGLGIEEKAVSQGVRGFFYEMDPLELIPKGVGAILDGELWVSREIMSRCILKQPREKSPANKETSDLTRREMEILALVAIGVKNEEIAEKLCISPHTVKTHIYNIFKKIRVPNRLQAALWAAKNL